MAVGTRIAGRYEVVGHLGSGGMGDVYEVEHIKLKRRFALKRLAADQVADPLESERVAERFLREARAAAATGHPGIVEVFDYDHAEEGWPFLVMEKLVGENLRERLRRVETEPLSESDVTHIGIAILSALQAVHECGIVHRDIKPANVFLLSTADSVADDAAPVRVKLVDFGLALLYSSERETEDLRLTRSGTLLGTPLYMSPEQVRAAAVDHRTDLYSTGTLLYECIAGKPPFSGQGFASVIAQIVERRPPIKPLGECSDRLRAAVLKALAKRPENRFASARDMIAVLNGEAAIPDLPTVTRLSLGDSGDWSGADEPAVWSSMGDSEQATRTIAEPALAGGDLERTEDTSAMPAEVPAGPVGRLEPRAEPRAEPAADLEATAPEARAPEPVDVPILAESRRRRASWWYRHNRMAILALAVMALLLGVSFMWWQRGAERAATDAQSQGSGQASGQSSGSSAQAERNSVTLPDGVSSLIEHGRLEPAEQALRRQLLRNPDDPQVQELYLLVALDPERERAYELAHKLKNRTDQRLSASLEVVVEAVLAYQAGRPLSAVPAVEALIAQRPDELLLHFLRAHLLRYGDRFLQARDEYLAILKSWPSFSPAVDGLLQRLLFLERVDEARAVVERYIASAPDGENLDMLELELAIGERKYRQALQRIDGLLSAERGRVDEFFQFQGDLELLLDNPKAAIAAYDQVGTGAKRNHYVAGALLHQGRDREARELLRSTIVSYPEDEKRSRLGKLGVDAALLALERDDAELAEQVASKLRAFAHPRLTQRYRAGTAFATAVARVLRAQDGDPDSFPLGARSPYHALLAVRGRSDRDALTLLRAQSEPDGMHFSVVSSHIYAALWLEHARVAFEHGELAEATKVLERVLRPRHYDAVRGVVIRRAMALQARLLRAAQRAGEASAVEERMRTLGLRP